MIIEKILSPANCVVPNSSKVYDELLNYVNKTYESRTENYKAIIFSLTYTRYCSEKKAEINRVHEPTSKFNMREYSKIIDNLGTEVNYKQYCDEAANVFDDLREQMKSAFAVGLSDSFQKAATTLSVTLKETVATVNQNLNQTTLDVAEKFNKIIKPEKKNAITHTKDILGKAAEHMLIVVLAGMYLLIIAAIMRFVVPSALEFIGKIVHEIFGPLIAGTGQTAGTGQPH